jgi:hypothetical protein
MKNVLRIACVLVILGNTMAAAGRGRDTVILSNKIRDGQWYSKIYIDNNRNNKKYEALEAFPGKEPGIRNKTFPYGRWIELSQYNKQLYLYYPCNTGNIYKVDITKSVYLLSRMEIDEESIVSMTAERPDKYVFNLEMPAIAQKRRVNFYLVDKEKGLALIENVGSNFDRYRLMVSEDKLRQYPMIVHECNEEREEFNFEKIDYATILKRLK